MSVTMKNGTPLFHVRGGGGISGHERLGRSGEQAHAAWFGNA